MPQEYQGQSSSFQLSFEFHLKIAPPSSLKSQNTILGLTTSRKLLIFGYDKGSGKKVMKENSGWMSR